jgi:soluble lytic murein transglycosylase-like protein
MNSYYQHKKLIKSILLITIILVVFVTTVSFSYKFFTVEEAKTKLNNIEKSMNDLRTTMNLNSKRQYEIQKIIKIINYYNQTMPADEQYQIANEIYQMSMKYMNLNVDLICATITHESALSWKKDVISPVGAMGLMQIMPQTGENLAKEEGIKWTSPEEILFDPILNIRLGCRYLSNLIHQYEIDGGLAAYNGGERRAALWIKNRNHKTDWTILWEETRTYVPAILKLYEKFQQQTGIL